jgi:hypothetical protein
LILNGKSAQKFFVVSATIGVNRLSGQNFPASLGVGDEKYRHAM